MCLENDMLRRHQLVDEYMGEKLRESAYVIGQMPHQAFTIAQKRGMRNELSTYCKQKP